MHGWSPYSDVHEERIRAHAKHQDKPGGSMEMKAFDDPDWLPVLVEEVGEVTKEINDYRHGLLTFQEFRIRVEAELLQVNAMAAAWLDSVSLDLRDSKGVLRTRT